MNSILNVVLKTHAMGCFHDRSYETGPSHISFIDIIYFCKKYILKLYYCEEYSSIFEHCS